MGSERYLVISDLQIPFEHQKALEFCKRVQKECRIPKTNVLCVGDEIDNYFMSRFPKDPDIELTPRGEIRAARERLKPWISAFPLMRVCTSNHGLRLMGKAYDCFMPSELIRPYKELFEIPAGWQYKDEWVFKTKFPFRMIHGLGYSGQLGHRNAAIDGRISTIIGHLHSHGGVNFIANDKQMIWGMNVGSLIDQESFAFKYAKHSRFKAVLSIGVVLNDGNLPIVVPYE